MREPEVVTGARETRFEAVQAAEAAAASRANSAKLIPDGKVIFQFIAQNYQLQLTSGIEERLPDGRLIVKALPKKVKAEGGFVVLDIKKDAEIIQMIREHSSYGTQFWDYADVLAEAKAKREAQAFEILASMEPEVKAKLIAALQASKQDTLGLPDRKTDKKS